MKDYRVKVISTLVLDPKGEQDLVSHINDLKAKHKLSDFINACIRSCWENPELLSKEGFSNFRGGMASTRKRFLHSTLKELSSLEQEVHSIHTLAQEMYIAAKFGKRIGLEERSRELLRAEFLLGRTLKKISTALGLSEDGYKEAVAESPDIECIADDALEYIISTYSEVVGELLTARQECVQQGTKSAVSAIQESDSVSKRSQTQSEGVGTLQQGHAEESREATSSWYNSDKVDWASLDSFIGGAF